jgi:hypothetical protein
VTPSPPKQAGGAGGDPDIPGVRWTPGTGPNPEDSPRSDVGVWRRSSASQHCCFWRAAQVGDADTACCSVAGLTPLTRRDIGVSQAWGRGGSQQLPSHELSPSPGWSLRCATGHRPPGQHRPRRCCAKPNDAAFQQRTARGGRAPLAPTPADIRARRAGQRWVVGCARWAWTHRPRRQAVGLVEQELQP